MDTQTEVRPVQVGDFFRCSWGYDQTNVDFYEVLSISASGKTVKVRQTQSGLVSSNGPADYIAPLPGTVHTYHPEILTKKLRWAGDRWAFRVASYASAYTWDCQPAYQTASGWGH